MPVYLDNAATTRVCPEAARAALEALRAQIQSDADATRAYFAAGVPEIPSAD